MWVNNGETPLWVVVVTLISGISMSILFAKVLDKYGSNLNPDTIRHWLAGGGIILGVIMVVIALRKLFS